MKFFVAIFVVSIAVAAHGSDPSSGMFSLWSKALDPVLNLPKSVQKAVNEVVSGSSAGSQSSATNGIPASVDSIPSSILETAGKFLPDLSDVQALPNPLGSASPIADIVNRFSALPESPAASVVSAAPKDW